MHSEVAGVVNSLAMASTLTEWLVNSYMFLKVLIGFSLIVFVHELGHFLAAKWMDIRVDRFAVGFFRRVCGYRRGEGFTFGTRPNYTPEEVAAKGYGETDYCLNVLPFGGYVKMLGQEDIQINEDTGEMTTGDDPRAFPNKPIGKRMVVVSAGVICNILFAVLLFMVVFLVMGKDVIAPVIGLVESASAAAKAGLCVGDRILAVDGHAVDSFDGVLQGLALAGANARLEVERAGRRLPGVLEIEVERKPNRELGAIGIAPMLKPVVAKSEQRAPGREGLQPGDRITQANGIPIQGAFELIVAFQNCGGRPVALTVERPDSARAGQTQTLTFMQPPRLGLMPQNLKLGASDADVVDSQHLLGLQQRRCVGRVDDGTSAQRAGFLVGDVIAQWGSVPDPLFSEIVANIGANNGVPVPVVVERDGRRVTLTVTPRRAFQLFGTPDVPHVGIHFDVEDRPPIVADIVPGTPAAALGMPRGAELLAIGARTTSNWVEVCEALRAAVGTTVEVRYRTGDDVVTGRLKVPSSLVNELDLPNSAMVRAIDGEDSVLLDDGQRMKLISSSAAVQKLLAQKVGHVVTIEYIASMVDPQPGTARFEVRADNTTPWQLAAQYSLSGLALEPLTTKITAHGNPLRATAMGAEYTWRILASIYSILKSMAAQNVGVQNVAGPLGIVGAAIQYAKLGWPDLLFFLAFISVNLAVINFLPLPVVDGGLMLFLILEKIRGKPLSAKMQIITTLTGLALIVLSFLFVTIQDITRLFGGS